MYQGVGDAVVCEIARGAGCGEEVETIVTEQGRSGEHLCLLFAVSGGEQDVLLGNAMTDRQHGFEQGCAGVFAETADFAGGGHVHTKHGVCLLQTVEGELRSLDANIVQIEKALRRFLDGKSEHDAGGEFDEVNLQHLADEGEGA